MSLLKRFATSVLVIRRIPSGVSDHGNTTYTTETETVNNVLVNRPTTKDITDGKSLVSGAKETLTIAFPKTYQKPLNGCFVVVPRKHPERKYKVVGNPQPVPADVCPTQWNYSVLVEAYDG